MASSLATALYYLGADVSLVASRGLEYAPKGINRIQIFSTLEFKENLEKELKLNQNSKKTYLFMVAAISDYVPSLKVDGKIKKETLGETWNLELKKNIDILASIEKNNIISVGFKAEMDKVNAKTNAENMLINKNLDAVCLNILDENNKFGDENNIIELIFKDESKNFSGNKLDISFSILENLEKKFEAHE
jgi:phosphopantothenoylcysteine decarboxylase/phosphopantothenate--cysteine ligase